MGNVIPQTLINEIVAVSFQCNSTAAVVPEAGAEMSAFMRLILYNPRIN